MIRLHELSKSYDGGATWAVRSLSLEVAAGELLVLLGESGCGKTTTLKLINRLVEPTSGWVEVDGRDTRGVDPVRLRRGIGYVFQGVGLLPHLTVAENVAVVPSLLQWSGGDTRARVEELLALVELPAETFGERMPGELSGGQQQRVGLARALAGRPRIVLMDEPLGALDPLTRDTLRDWYVGLHRRLGLTTVMVTHDMTEALLMADRIGVMRAGELAQLATPRELLRNPADGYVAALMRTPRREADRLEALAAG